MSERFPTTGSGKGPKFRPVNEKTYRQNHDFIFNKNKDKNKKKKK